MDFDLFAENRAMKFWSSFIFSSARLFCSLYHTLNQLRGFVPELVVADVHLDLSVVDIHDVGAHIIKEVTVVGYNDDRARSTPRGSPPARIPPQRRGGWSARPCRIMSGFPNSALREQNLDLLITGQGIHLLVENVLRQTQTLDKLVKRRTQPPSRSALRTRPPARQRRCRPPLRNPPWRRARPSPA